MRTDPASLGRKLPGLRGSQGLAAAQAGGARGGAVHRGSPDAADGPEGCGSRQTRENDDQRPRNAVPPLRRQPSRRFRRNRLPVPKEPAAGSAAHPEDARKTVPTRNRESRADRVNRQFQAPRPNALWVADFTDVAMWQGFVSVALVIDTFARRIVGWRERRMRRSHRPCRFRPGRSGAGAPRPPAGQGQRPHSPQRPWVPIRCHKVHRSSRRGRR
jgi:transposase InsO family protein